MANLHIVLLKDEVTRTATGGKELHYGTEFTVQADKSLETVVTEAVSSPMLVACRVKVKGEDAPALAARVAANSAEVTADLAFDALAEANTALAAAAATLAEVSAAVVALQAIETAADAAWDDAVAAASDASDAYDLTVSDLVTAAALAVSTAASVEAG